MSKSLERLKMPVPLGPLPSKDVSYAKGWNDCLAALKGKVVVVEDLPSEEEMIKAIISGWEIDLPNDYRLHLIAQAIMALI